MGNSILLGNNVDERLVGDFANSIGCLVGCWPIKFLGLPLGGNLLGVDFWKSVLAKVSKTLDGWKKAYLSKGGRLTLIQSMLAALPTCFLSLFRRGWRMISKKVLRDFLWEGHDDWGGEHFVSWSTVCLPNNFWGLGISNILNRNKALTIKWLWRDFLEQHSHWAMVIPRATQNIRNPLYPPFRPSQTGTRHNHISSKQCGL